MSSLSPKLLRISIVQPALQLPWITTSLTDKTAELVQWRMLWSCNRNNPVKNPFIWIATTCLNSHNCSFHRQPETSSGLLGQLSETCVRCFAMHKYLHCSAHSYSQKTCNIRMPGSQHLNTPYNYDTVPRKTRFLKQMTEKTKGLLCFSRTKIISMKEDSRLAVKEVIKQYVLINTVKQPSSV